MKENNNNKKKKIDKGFFLGKSYSKKRFGFMYIKNYGENYAFKKDLVSCIYIVYYYDLII
jgi:hypothetical protein